MPVRLNGGPGKGELEWRRVNRPTLLTTFRQSDLRRRLSLWRARRSPRAGEAEVFLHDRLPAYISFERYDRNQAQLKANKAARVGTPGREARSSPGC